ncbi:kinesin-like protein NACK2 [Cucurbita moschata]|uniref:Kinesin-like protein n=1 Tax=Cucurbita moschata TaxID=3662 RepID=A0A6J1F3L4_CUCMO|nr:kinesin-like protein NACK2 [Cucurbita moschata]XP_022933058.1 kinesin-like protein NACK2 [Cucurbita moschata]
MVRTPATPLSKIQRTPSTTPGGPRTREEKILVTVRVRPLNRREQAMYDLIAWDCLDEHTIVFKNPNHDRPVNPYCFDKVFDPTCSTQRVYEEGARDVALSALTGMNATIFAYGQTSSGKTFTMRGITENAVNDIFVHIKNTPERNFLLKFSALEIYNETVVDLLNSKTGSLRLLDDPEKGTTVEKLVEEIVKDSEHLRQLIGICEAQRQVGETALNDKSSRSHQIIRLTIESSLREATNCVKSFIASLNLVDLAGSERVSQTSADGIRLKEGSHINRSLLTLTTVIRKLSGGRRGGHIPYRDSKLTRILQSSLGGNARTAIICTMSPALSHVEQTRNTLSFATSAKEVTNNAQVNMVVSDNRLLKHLQSEVARLEAELKSPEVSSTCLQSLLLEKDKKIQQMEKEIKELRCQLEQEKKVYGEPKGIDECGPSHVVRCLSFRGDDDRTPTKIPPGSKLRSVVVGRKGALRRSIPSIDPSIIVHEIRKLEHCQRQLGEEANRALDVLHREVASHKLGSQEASETIAKMLSEIKDMHVLSSIPQETIAGDKTNLMEEILRFKSEGTAIESLEKKLENVQKSIDNLVSSYPSPNDEDTPELKNQHKRKKVLPFALNNGTNMHQIIRSPCSPMSSSRSVTKYETENRVPSKVTSALDERSRTRKITPNCDENCRNVSRDSTPLSQQSNSVNVKKMQRMFKTAAEENIRSIRAYVTELKERVAKLQYQKQLLVCQVLDLEKNENGTEAAMDTIEHTPVSWHTIFEDQRKQIIMLWHLCHVSLVHRTQFYLLFKGDPSDQIYMEVEWRRLTWLEQHLAELGNASPALLGDEPASSVYASVKALKQEREYLAKRVSSKLTAEEREMLYVKWEVPQVGKQRRLQLVNKLWTDPLNMKHIQDSAKIVAKLVGFCESGEHVSKEMFQLNFVCPSDRKTWMGWNLISNLLNL